MKGEDMQTLAAFFNVLRYKLTAYSNAEAEYNFA